GTGAAPPAIETFTQACNGATVEGPYTADDWDAIHPGEVRFVDSRTRRFTSAGGTAANAAATDPFARGPCRAVAATDGPGAAPYRLPRVRGKGSTLLGAPTVIAHIAATSGAAQIAARLWDVAPDGMQTLVAQSLHRPRTDNRGPQVFQIHANGWHFAAGHR